MEFTFHNTMLYAGLLTLLYFVLSVRIIRLRWRDKVGLGTGESADLKAAVRIHGNFSEYVPLCLLLLFFIEASGGPLWLVHALGAALFIARISHAIGLTKSAGTSPPRAIGVLLTFVVLLTQAGYMVGFSVGRLLGS